MKKIRSFFVLYLLSLATLFAGCFGYCQLVEKAEKTYSGIYWIFAVGAVTVFVLVLFISARALKNTELHGKRAVVSNCITLAISTVLFLFALLSPALHILLRKQDWFFYLSTMLLASDIFNLTLQLRKTTFHKGRERNGEQQH